VNARADAVPVTRPLAPRLVKLAVPVLRHAVLVLFCLVILLPLLWIALSSLKPVTEIYRVPTSLVPEQPTLQWYDFVLNKVPDLPRYYANSLIVTLSATLGSVAISCLAGYAFARLRFPGRDQIFWALIISLFLPTSITSLFALYELTDKLGLLDTRLGLILPYTNAGIIVAMFIMRSVFLSIPAELEDAAAIDGCGAFQTFARIMLPLAAMGVVVVTILNFIGTWGEYVVARTLTYESARTLPVAIATLQPQTGEWHFSTVAAAYMLMFGPPFLLMALVQRWFMKGLTAGGIKF
jgi:ABC-type glycerol-3-phosphate transport system permease component